MWWLDPLECSVQVAEPNWSEPGVFAPSMSDPLTEHRQCRVCSSTNLLPYLDLGDQPLANALRSRDDTTPEFRAPLHIQACLDCTLSQLTVVVDPKLLYSNYVYYSGANPAWHTHCEALADLLEPLEGKFVLEIASNDGTFLKECDRRKAVILGVEPATNFLTCGYPILNQFWGTWAASRPIISGKVDWLVAQNVLGHVHDVRNFMEGIALALSPSGKAVIEVPYLLDLLCNTAFDTVYHEHLSYWTVMALQKLADSAGLTVNGVARLPALHGGSIRVWLSRNKLVGRSVTRLIQQEREALNPETYRAFAKRVQELVTRIDAEMPAFGYGAAAKATVLLNMLQHAPLFVFDDSQHKWDKFIPGTLTRIGEPLSGEMTKLKELAILAWNWAEPLMEQARERGFRGRFFVPLPEPRWLD